jgi:pyruvate formate lyase activating enzyme
MKCEDVCSFGAINHTGHKVTVNEVVREVMRDELFYNNSGGGVTISGGEPLYQIDFTLSLLKDFKKKSLHTTIDTTGYAKWEELERIIDHIDLVLFDIKHLNQEIHQKGTGVENKLILNNLERILEKELRIWIRVPVIPDFNDSNHYMTKLAEFLSEKPIEKVSLLKYHEWGRHKYKYLDKPYPLSNSFFINDEQLEKFKKILETYKLNVTLDY